MILDLSYTEPQIEIFFETDVKFLVVTKGRRFGLTHGAGKAFIEWAIEGKRLLWGDTINSNIDRYVQRYIEPDLKKNEIPYKWNAQKKELRILDGHIDFRSADIPQNWEGFGYDIIFLNEAGIILKDPYLFTNAVLPMLMDFPNSRLIAGGVPKGKIGKDGKTHAFYKMAQAGIANQKGYKHLNYSSYDNPLLRNEDIDQLKDEINRMNPDMVKQEIYGQFVDNAGGLLWDELIIERQRITKAPELTRIIVSIDPAVSKTMQSDETGIIVLGKSANGHIYILEDLSGKYSPNEWATVAYQAFKRWDADCYVAEKNQGGDMVQTVIRQVDERGRIILVTATKGKALRAEPIYSLYEQGKVWHVGMFPHLESQMATFNPDSNAGSPDRVDALVHGATELDIQIADFVFV